MNPCGTVLVAADDSAAFVVASLVPVRATLRLPAAVGGGAGVVEVNSTYPFLRVRAAGEAVIAAGAEKEWEDEEEDAVVTVTLPMFKRGAKVTMLIRIPGWADRATVDGRTAANGTLHKARGLL